MVETQVVIVGAGPVGLTLALDLGRRGVRCLLIEREEHSIQLPRMERCNPRTMEIFRRLGIAEAIRDAGLPRDAPMDVFLAPSLSSPPLAHLPYPSVAEACAEIAAHNDGRPLEPSQVISQYTLEPLLRSFVDQQPTVDVRFGWELTSLRQDPWSVTAQVRTATGAQVTVRASYLVGCDGGTSTVRHQVGIRLEGEGGIRTLRQALFRSDDLYESIPMGKGRHYHLVQPGFPFLILQDSTRHWTMHHPATSDAEMAPVFERAVGMPVTYELRSVNRWTQHLLCADRYRAGRVFIAGDAAHLVVPTGGLGMNTGVGDAIDLSWKLAAVLAGWGGPQLLPSYEQERRPIGLRSLRASRAAMEGREHWRQAETPGEMARRFDQEQRKVTEILGIEAGYRYVGSPLIWPEPGEGPDPDSPRYVPTTWPGARLPHVWLEDGTALHDRLGQGYTLLRLGRTRADTTGLEAAIRALGAPLEVLDVPDPAARDLYERDLILVRPDLHVVWRGNRPPDRPGRLAAVATGQAPTTRSS
ncbi:MAG TPA: FAD-dependent monooxygenase [Candidatus Dormibacteraeota bacterium]|nr:FAD-dependent monooxygenase [Candidatus Dormibacteraeota bacterium]